jgi:hypothetical protein
MLPCSTAREESMPAMDEENAWRESYAMVFSVPSFE